MALRLSVLLCLLCLTVAAACGSSDSDGSSATQAGSDVTSSRAPSTPDAPKSEPTDNGADAQEAVRHTLVRYYDAFLSGDGETACGYLTDAGKRQLIQQGGADGPKSCAEVIKRYGSLFGKQDADDITIETAGDTATATVRFDKPLASQRLKLQRDGDEWKIVSQDDR